MVIYRRRRYSYPRSRTRTYTRTRRSYGRSNYKRRPYKRSFKRKSKYRNPIPTQASMKFKYIDGPRSYGLTLASSNNALFAVRGNSIYDPDVAIGGASVLNFGLYLGIDKFYQRYKVSGCKITCYLQNQFAFTSPFYVSIYPIREGGNTVTNPTIQKMTSIRNCVTKRYYAATNKAFRIKNYLSTRKFYNVKDLDDRDFNGTYNSNPAVASMWNWVVHVWRESGLTVAPDLYVQMNTKLIYYTHLKRTEAPYTV